MKTFYKSLYICSLILIFGTALFGGNTGKIVGKITDAISGEPIVGVNVLVVGTTRGTTTDIEGQFSIIGVSIGTYTVRASQVGYGSYEIKDVKVTSDQTTPLNIKLTSSEVQLTGVTITADQQLVNSLATSSTQTVGEKSIQSIPNVKTVEDVLKLQAGVVKVGNQLFLRGGRADEVQYLVDGVPTNSIVGNAGDLATTSGANAQLQQLYSGVQSGVVGGGASGLSVSANAIQSVSVQTSGFDADYGNAQSGIINIVTKSGGDRYTGSAQFRTDRISSDNQNELYGAFSIGGPEPLSKYVMPPLGLKIPGTMTFFLSLDMSRSDGPYKLVHNEFFHPMERKIQLNGLFGSILNASGFHYNDYQDNSFTFNTKLKYDISGDDQMSYGYRASLSSRHGYSRSWKYRADSSSLGAGINIQNNLQWQHFFSPRSFFRFYLAKLESRDGNDVAGIKPPDYSSADPNQYDNNNDWFSELGTSQRWYDSRTIVWSTRFDFNAQIHPLHLLKTGAEFYLEEINSTEIISPTKLHRGIPTPDTSEAYQHGAWPGYGEFRYHINAFPNRGALYIQDNIELAGLNLHVGLRYDYLDIGAAPYHQNFIDEWIRAYQWIDSVEGQPVPDWVYNLEYGDTTLPNGKKVKARIHEGRGLQDMKRFWYYFTHGYYSPRLSIGYPVTDRIVFYFNYGHFLQFPDRSTYYRDPFVADKDAWIGNPDLKPKRTVQYEAGFEDQFTDDMAFSLHAFYKDIFDYETLVPRGTYYFYKNLDYASSRGFDFTLNQAFAGNFSIALSYSFQIAKGRSSNKNAAIFKPEQFQLARETRLNWDQNHTANLFATYRVGPREEGRFFGLPFVNNYGISVTWSYGSGLPYNGYSASASHENQIQYNRRINSETGPYTSTVNLSLYKGFNLFETINLLMTLDITNLLNRKNPTGGAIFNYTGRVYQYGDLEPSDPASKIIVPYRQAEQRLLDPTNFDAPRQIIFGLKLNWE